MFRGGFRECTGNGRRKASSILEHDIMLSDQVIAQTHTHTHMHVPCTNGSVLSVPRVRWRKEPQIVAFLR